MILRMLQAAAAVLATLLYLAAATWTARRLLFPGDAFAGAPSSAGGAHARSTGWALLAAAVAVHTLVVIQNTWAGPGLNLALPNALSLVTWLAALGLLAACLRWELEHLGLLLLPLAAFAAAISVLGPSRATLPETPWLEAHIITSMLAYGALLAAAIQAGVLAVVERRLRLHQATGVVRRLPALHTLEQQLFALVAVGFALLTAAVGTGLLFLEEVLAGRMIHKTTLTLTAWLVFGGLLLGRRVYGWRGQTAVRWTLGGFVALGLGYFGTKFVLELILGA